MTDRHCDAATDTPLTRSVEREASNVVQLPMLAPAKRLLTQLHVAPGVTHPRFAQRRNANACDEVVWQLERLLEHARQGHISGLAWAVSFPEGLHPRGVRMAGDTVGEAARNALFGSEMARALQRKADAMGRGEPVEH